MRIFGSTLTVVGCFKPVAIVSDIQKRGGTAASKLEDTTNYVLVGDKLTEGDNAIIKEASQLGIPCITLDHYKDQMIDKLEEE